jgi:ornithine carbamoyltransferase
MPNSCSTSPARSLLSLKELGASEIYHLVQRAVSFGREPSENRKPLDGKTVGIYFRRSSTRTRTAFTVGALKLGAHTVSYGPKELQISTGETYEDTGRVLSGFLDALVVRTNDPASEMEALARHSSMPIINAMSSEEHPTQALADLATIQEHFGYLEGIHLVYLGEGNNSASALARAFSKIRNSRVTFLCPRGYGLADKFIAEVQQDAEPNGSRIEQRDHMNDLPKNVDVVYTTRWHTMGIAKPDPNWKESFLPFSVSQELMVRLSKPEGTVFMHDLPAVRGDDVHSEVLDGPQSLAWRQAEHKMFSAMAVLEWCIVGS